MNKIEDYLKLESIIRSREFLNLANADSKIPFNLCYSDSLVYIQKANNNPNVNVVLTNEKLADEVSKHLGLVICNDPRSTFYNIHTQLLLKNKYKVDFNFGKGKNITIHPTAFVSDKSYIGNNVTIGPNVNVMDNVYIDDNVYIEAGASIGGEGILYYKENGNIKHVKHGGGVKIGKNVTILSNAAIAKSIFPYLLTEIQDNSIIGVSSIIGHEAFIGKNVVISGNSLIARGAQCLDNTWIGSQSVIREYTILNKGAIVKAGSIVVKNVGEGKEVSGNFAVEHAKHLRAYVKLEKGII